MKTRLESHNGIHLQRTTNPTEEERLNFLEHMIRRINLHEPLCESKRPDIEGNTKWWSTPKFTFPYPCDCWLSEPFGSTGLTGDYS